MLIVVVLELGVTWTELPGSGTVFLCLSVVVEYVVPILVVVFCGIVVRVVTGVGFMPEKPIVVVIIEKTYSQRKITYSLSVVGIGVQ